MRLLLASGNRKKRNELAALVEPLGLELVTPDELGGLPPVEEDRDTFAGNAAKKAVSAARASGLWSLADDSGLEVEALDGAPGVRSAAGCVAPRPRRSMSKSSPPVSRTPSTASSNRSTSAGPPTGGMTSGTPPALSTESA